MIEALKQFHTQHIDVIDPLIVGTLVSIVCSVIGCFIILRRMSFLADAIAHSMLAGVIGGYLVVKIVYHADADLGAMLIGAILAGVFTVVMVGFVTRFSRLKEDTAIGIMYTGIFAAGAFLISLKSVGPYIQIDIRHFIEGNVLLVGESELWLLAIVTSIVLSVVILFFRPLQLTSFDPIMAAAIGIPVMAVDYLLTICTSLVVVSGVQVAGVILVVALIITPAASAFLLTNRLSRMIIVSAVISVVGYWAGFFVAVLFDASPGPAVVIVMTGIFLLCLVASPEYGLVADWWRRRSKVPQETMEDVLGSVLRFDGEPASVDQVLKFIDQPNQNIRNSITLLKRQGLLEVDGDFISLTEQGTVKAKQLVRAHRLWETYLDQTSTPKDEIHEKAHLLEHLQDPTAVEYLDDKLGHPITDPHGSEIPVDSALLSGGREVLLSLLREGYRATICSLNSARAREKLTVGQKITMGPRSADGAIWTITLDSGGTLEFSHDEADEIVVRLIVENHG